MPLTVRANGSGSSNLVTASWWNDYYNLLTGAMSDQEVTIKNTLVVQAIGTAPSTAPTLALVAGTGMGIGVYVYSVTFINAPDGESLESSTATITTTSGNQQVRLSSLPIGPTGTTGRTIYRTAVGGSQRKLLHTIADNTTTSYTDSAADGTLGANPPSSPDFGGALVLKNSSGVTTFQINNDGTFSSGSGNSLGNTVITGTLSVSGVVTASAGVNGNGKFGVSTPGDVVDGSGSDTWLHARGTTNTIHFNVNNQDVMLLDYQGHLTLSNNIIWQNGNGLGRTSNFSGTGTGTYNHGLGAVPTFIAINIHAVNSSATIGYDSETSTQAHITLGASLGFYGFALR